MGPSDVGIRPSRTRVSSFAVINVSWAQFGLTSEVVFATAWGNLSSDRHTLIDWGFISGDVNSQRAPPPFFKERRSLLGNQLVLKEFGNRFLRFLSPIWLKFHYRHQNATLIISDLQVSYFIF